MPIPEFILELRRHVGHAPLWLIGCTAVVVSETESGAPQVLLVRRADTGVWSPVTGIVDPGEDPHVAAVREVWEEACVRAEVTSLVWVSAGELVHHVNGDQARYLDHTFRCRYLEGTPRVGDDENLQATWFSSDELPPLPRVFADRIAAALCDPPRPILGSRPNGLQPRGVRADRQR
ncbi:MAG: NUDIX domain-containing protein [Micrococcales bacterium]|nr:NUDIX domain-containing protein [Micrococcales bacterium]